MTTQRPSPQVDPCTQPFFDAARAARLLLPYCAACDQYELPGTPTCTGCLSTTLDWREARREGEIHSYLVFHRSFHPAFTAPYAVCMIELDAGPRLIGEVVDVELADLQVGMRVEVVFDNQSDTGAPPIAFRRARVGARVSAN